LSCPLVNLCGVSLWKLISQVFPSSFFKYQGIQADGSSTQVEEGYIWGGT
jgi:hypothetical protein